MNQTLQPGPQWNKALSLMALVGFLYCGPALRSSQAAQNRLGRKPYMGWSSWSLEATKYPGYGGENWLTADHLKTQSDLMHNLVQKHGYTYINIDAGWRGGWDDYGRPTPDPRKFPRGIRDVAKHVHHYHQKLGIYYIPGIDDDLYNLNPPIYGTRFHIQDIVFKPARVANGWGGGHKIDYSQPGAQEYINSIAREFASWGIDFLKFDGVTPGSDHYDLKIDARPDVAAWGAALKQVKRPIWFELSWKIDGAYIDFWRKYANGWRITTDVETYGKTLTGWKQITWRFDTVRSWVQNAGPGKGWNDLDSLDVGSGALDGLTDEERQTMMTLWAVECAPLYIGDDLAKLDPYGLQLLTNDEVIAVDQAGHPASLLKWGDQQVWYAANGDGSYTVALFNLDDKSSANVTAQWTDLGISGPARVRDLWSHDDLGISEGSFSARLAPHASRLLKVTPQDRT